MKTLKKAPEYNFDTDVAKFTERQMEAVRALDSGVVKYLLYGGALGGGKSYFLRWIAVRLLVNYAKDYGLEYVQVMLACEDYPSLKDRQIGKMAREFPPWLGTMYVDHKEYGRCFILHKSYGSGVICLRNLDDPAKYQSAEFAAILVDELTKNDLNTFTDLRMRLRWPGIPDMACIFIGATNPGGVGHAFCKALWMDKIFPDEFLKPTDYSKTFKYIPSKAEDNPHLDDAYWAGLQTLPPHLRAAFRDGSWDLFKGQAFQEWSRSYHVVDPMYFEHKDGKKRLFPEGAPLFMTFDWGFGAPFSVGWWWVDSDGRKYRFSEWYGWAGTPGQGMRIPDTEIAAGIIKREQIMGLTVIEERLGLRTYNPHITRLCDPTCFNKKPDYRGGGQMPSTAEIFMNEGVQMRPGDPSRALKYRQFHEHLRVPYDDDGKVCGVPMIQIYSDCIHFIRTIPALILDEHNIEDIDTNSEDHCLHGDTKVYTDRGLLPIRELVGTSGKVLTPNGYVTYNRCWLTRKNTDIVEILFDNGSAIKCTPDHKILNKQGTWVEAQSLTNEECHVIIKEKMEAFLCESTQFQKKHKSLTEKITGNADITFKEKVNDYIEKCGSIIMEIFQKVAMFTTETQIEQTTRLKTLRYLLEASICPFMPRTTIMETGLNLNMKAQEYGMEAKKELSGTKNNMSYIVGRSLRLELLKYVNSAEKSSMQKNTKTVVRAIAQIDGDGNKVSDAKNENVKSVGRNLQLLNHQKSNIVLRNAISTQCGRNVKVKSVKSYGKSDVFCFNLPYPHAFVIEGGIVSHNCFDEACHVMMHRPVRAEKQVTAVKRPPQISEVARLERENIWQAVKDAEELERMFYDSF